MTLLHNTDGKRMYQRSGNDGEQRTDKPVHIWADPWAAYPLLNDINTCILNVKF